MWRVPDLSRRVREPELMDDPSLDPAEHRRALAGLSRLNRYGGGARIVWDAIRPLVAAPGHAGLSILDVACGGGDIPLVLIRKAHQLGATLDVHGCDISELALTELQRRASRKGAGIETFRLDAIHDQIPGEYDIVMCSLFMHHIDDDDALELLYRMKAAARKMIVVSDLVRSRAAYRMAVAASRILSRSHVVHVDAEKSMRAAFTIQEMLWLANEAGLSGAEVVPRWPCRMLLTWKRER